LSKGSEIRYDNIECKRPGTGISPVEIDRVIAMRLKVDLKKDDIITWEMLG